MKLVFKKNLVGLAVTGSILVVLLGGFIVALSHQRILRNRIVSLISSLDRQQRHGKAVQVILDKAHLLDSKSHAPGAVVTRKIKQLAETHGVSQVTIKEWPQHLFYEKEEVHVIMRPIQINFIVESDDNFWEFLKDLQTNIPGIMMSKGLFLEKVNEGDKIILKGSYRFEWYILCRSPEKF